MNDETMNSSETPSTETGGRRGFLKGAGVAALGVAAAGLLTQGEANAQRGGLDPAVLNFALNLEYLEAEFYLAAIGSSLVARGIGINGVATGGNDPNGGALTLPTTPAAVDFSSDPLIGEYAREIADDEAKHVAFLRAALGSAAVARPPINLINSFQAIFPGFQPFANPVNFLLASFVFEDVGVTAYAGGARLIANKDFLEAAAKILGVEAYHAGSIRTILIARDRANPGLGIAAATQTISDARDAVAGTEKDQGIIDPGVVPDSDSNIAPTDANALAFSRSTREVLNIVYLASGTPTAGGFFPNGLNGAIR